MNEIWVIAQVSRENGHGCSSSIISLPTVGPYGSGPHHPAFKNKSAALEYINSQSFSCSLIPVMLKIADQPKEK